MKRRPSRCTFTVILPSPGFDLRQAEESLLRRTVPRPRTSGPRPFHERSGLAVLVVALGSLAAVPSAAARLNGLIAYGILDADGSVYTVRPDGTDSRRVLRDAQWVELSRDGRQLAYARDSGNLGLWTADTDGTDRRRVVNPATRKIEGQLGYQTWEPSWSPNSERIAFAA